MSLVTPEWVDDIIDELELIDIGAKYELVAEHDALIFEVSDSTNKSYNIFKHTIYHHHKVVKDYLKLIDNFPNHDAILHEDGSGTITRLSLNQLSEKIYNCHVKVIKPRKRSVFDPSANTHQSYQKDFYIYIPNFTIDIIPRHLHYYC